MLYPKPSAFLPESLVAKEAEAVAINIQLSHDTSLEEEAAALSAPAVSTRGIWSSIKDWFKDQTLGIAKNVVVTIAKFHSNVVAPLEPVMEYEPWGNTGGWERKSWMSKIPDTTLVCLVNIPGTHDSGTDVSTMGVLARETGAAVQSYSIGKQFDLGARFFDLRIGTGYEGKILFQFDEQLKIQLFRDEERISETDDLELFHGPMSTGVWYRKSLEELAAKVYDSDEFIFIKTQWEDLSYGLLGYEGVRIGSMIGFSGYDPFTQQIASEETQKQSKSMIELVSMDIAHRIQKEVGSKYGNKLFINYSSDLTVEKARGHIILLESKYDKARALDNPQVTYIFSWADNQYKHGHICAYDQGTDVIRNYNPHNIDFEDGYGYNMYLQNFYEMRLWQGDLIKKKKDSFHKLGNFVTDLNLNKDKRILGFNALNANGGATAFYDLDTYEFAHMFNGYAFNEYVANLKSENDRWHCGIVTMDHFGAQTFTTYERGVPIFVYGDVLSWAVIESNFYRK